MNKVYTTLILLLLFLVQSGEAVSKEILAETPQKNESIIVSSASTSTPLIKRIDVLNVGSIGYPGNLEERHDIPFKLLVDEEFRKLVSDTVDYEKLRPTLLFFEKGFEAPHPGGKKVSFGYISINALSGTYRFPQEISEIQKSKIESSIKHDVDTNLVGTQFQIKKWNPFEFQNINGLVAIQYSYEQTLKGKDQTNIIATNLYDSDLQLQIVLSAPKKEYKKWLTYYNQILGTFKRNINIADMALFEYPTDIHDCKEIPFRHLVDKEFKRILGDSVDYEKFRPGLLLLKRDFTIADTTNVAPFGNISFNIVPEYGSRALKKDSIKLDALENNIKQNVLNNLDSTAYKVNKWGEFKVVELGGVPAIQYSYQQQLRDQEPSEVYATYLFNKSAQIQVNMSSPLSTLPDWKDKYQSILQSYRHLIKVSNTGTMYYPAYLEERSDIPFALLVDKESKKKLGDSIDYNRFRPNLLFLKQDFNEKDSTQLASFGSITVNVQEGDFHQLSNPDSISTATIENEMKASVERNLKNTGYSLNSWDSFSSGVENGSRFIAYSYTQQLSGTEPKHICITYFYTETAQVQAMLTSSESEYTFWKPEYDQMIKSFRLSGWR